MKTLEFLTHLRSLDILLQRKGDKLRISAPRDVLTPELQEELALRKTELLDFLRNTEPSAPASSQSIEKAARTGPIPLSFAQQRLWFLDQLTPGSAAYIIPLGVRLRGKLDVSVLEKSIGEIVRRQEGLRTVFTSADGIPEQVILNPEPLSIPVSNLGHLPAAERLRKAEEMTQSNAQTPFDLAQGPLLRARLIRLEEQDHVLLIAVHHIVFDAWSVGVFSRELSLFYNAFRSGQTPRCRELDIQYVDFSCWQRAYLSDAVREKQLAYWKQKLEGELPVLELPADRPRPAIQTSRGNKRALELPALLTGRLKELGHKEGASLAMTLLTAFNVLLRRLSGQDDILVGIPVAGRNRMETEGLIGFFVNTLVIRTGFSASPTFRQLLIQIREATLGAYAHQDMPFEELLEVLAPQRELNRTPLFQAFFNHLNIDAPRLNLAGLTAEPFGNLALESKFDLTLYVAEPEDRLSLALVYNADLFDEDRMAGLLEQYHLLLEQICASPDLTVEQYSLLTPRMKAVVPDPTAMMEVRWSGAVQAKVSMRAARAPEQVAVEDAHGKWSYSELERLSGGLAGWLRAQGIHRNDVVAVYGHRSAPLVLALLGILRAQGAFCILDPAHPAQRLCRLIDTARPKAWLEIGEAGEPADCLKTLAEQLTGARRLRLPLTREALRMPELAAHKMAPEETDPESPAYVTFTSGTTGEPKCIVGTHRPLSHFMEWHCKQFEFTRSDRFSMLSGLAHDPLLRDIFAPLWCGATICIPASDDILSPGRLAEWMHDSRATVTHLTPAMSLLLTESIAGASAGLASLVLPTLKFAFFGGDVLTRREASRLHRLAPGAQIVNFYGATETPQAMAWHRVSAAELRVDSEETDLIRAGAWSIPIGTAIQDAQLLVLNKSGSLAGAGEIGEIFVRTPYLSQGYVNDPALSRQRFVGNRFTGRAEDRFYRTGDLGRYRPNGIVDFCGRADRQVKIRGHRVELREIETALATHSRVRDCVVGPCETSGGLRLVGWIVPIGTEPPSSESLREHLKAILPDFMVPEAFGFLKTLPLTPNGKINHSLLPIPNPDRPEAATGYVPPRNRVERVLTKVWAEVMGLERVGVFDNFFELGGHSLSAIQLIARLRSTLQIDFPLRSIFIEPTIADLSKHIRYDALTKTFHFSSEIPRWNCLVPIQPKGSRPPLFLVCGAHADEDAFLRFMAHLIPHLGLDQPVYGFKPRGLDGQAKPQSSVEEIARDYLAEVRQFLPEGPYLLAGECVGGVVAFEMAQQLKQQDQEVALLALLDTDRPTSLRAFFSKLRYIKRNVNYRATKICDILKSPPRNWGRLALEIIRPKLKTLFPKTAEDHVIRRIRQVENGYPRLTYRYRAQPYPGEIVLIVNEHYHALDSDLGWKGVAQQGLTIHCVSGDHLTRLTVHGKIIAARLLKCIDEAQPRIPSNPNAASGAPS